MKVMLALQLRNKDGLPQLEYQLKHKNTGIWTKITKVMMMKRIREEDWKKSREFICGGEVMDAMKYWVSYL